MDIIKQLSEELSLKITQVESAVKLLDEGNTVPFIARYRKEVTGSLDDGQLRDLEDRLNYLRNLDKRREEIKSSIESQGALTEELAAAIDAAKTLAALEDLYMPYKKKRRTRAMMAKEKGLEPLALKFYEQTGAAVPEVLAEPFVDAEKGVETVEDAIAGAKDIIAEMISDDAAVRGALREFLKKTALIRSTSEETEPGVYSMYYDFTEPVSKVASYRVLALDRGEREEVLKVSIECERDKALAELFKLTVKKGFSPSIDVVRAAAEDSFDRLIFPSLERELRSTLTENAAEQAIKVFALNLKPLLMQPPVKGRVTLGLDPAYRTGCKIAVVDATGKVLDTTVVYPTPPQNKTEEAAKKLTALIKKHGVSTISIGNGTASKESEIFVADLIRQIDVPVSYMVVSEAGASVYSASKLAAEEFPQFDVSLRSAVSIARRLQDPLAELVKIDPKAIGVGQYQHDMPKNRLDQALGGVVEDCVNTVGVDVNTASFSLLSYVAGIGPALAKSIVAYREENGHFTSRKQLLKVPKLGKKAFEQSAGFLRVAESDDPLDNTAVHPESYKAAEGLIKLCGLAKSDLKTPEKMGELNSRADLVGRVKLADELGIGLPTLNDIVTELLKPGRDPRDELPPPMLRSELLDISDLKPDMVLQGTVRNVVDFGAFVDIGVHQDGLVHISRICDRFLKHPSEAVRVGDVVKVKVLEVDAKRKRISLTMRDIEG
ncbi:MAG: RNA-binding transcriptional accessory protein [Oscillospiraceae bacterium]|nr:RNA-binding transcriptional accessory protein [Oscillospiraceae bacterium]